MKVSSFTCGGYFGGYCVLITDGITHIISDEVGLIDSFPDKEKAFSTLVSELGYDEDEDDEQDISDLRKLFDYAHAKGEEV